MNFSPFEYANDELTEKKIIKNIMNSFFNTHSLIETQSKGKQ